MSVGMFNSVGGYENFVPPPPPVYYGVVASNLGRLMVPFNLATDFFPTNLKFTVEFWIKSLTGTVYDFISGSGGKQYLLELGNSHLLRFEYSTRYNIDEVGLNRLAMISGDGGANNLNRFSNRYRNWQGTGDSGTDGLWHHVAYVYDTRDANSRIFVDGLQAPNIRRWVAPNKIDYVNMQDDATILGGGAYNNTGVYRKLYVLGSSVNSAFNITASATMYNLRITRSALYTANFTPPTTDLNVITNCVFCMESYKQGSNVVIRDKVSGQNIVDLSLYENATGRRYPAPA